MMLMFLIQITILLSTLIFCFGVLLSMKSMMNNEKLSPFECGFSPKFNTRLPFSMRFFLLCLMFLIFDVELILFFPFSTTVLMYSEIKTLFMLITGCIILLFGLFYEWNLGMLDWSL